MKKVAVVGSNGYIAGFIMNSLQKNADIAEILKIDQVKANDVYYLDLEKAEQFDYELLNDFEYIIFTAAISGPDKCADAFAWCYKINVIGTGLFIENALKKNCKVLFFSSDAVFGNIQGMVYNEDSTTQALTPYGKMKKTIEDKFKHNPLFKAIRLSYVVSAKDRFVSYCLECLQKGETAEIFHPFYRNCICISDVVKAVQWLLENWDEFRYPFLNVTGVELVSRVRIADEINRICGEKLKYTIENPKEEFYNNRPKITQMESLYLYKNNILENESFTKKIQKELEDINI